VPRIGNGPRAPRLLALATAVPPHVLHQSDAKALAERVFAARGAELERLLPVFDHAGIETRYSCLPAEQYLERQGWKARNQTYVQHALELTCAASETALARAGLVASDMGAVVTISTTGLATSSLDALLLERLGMRCDTFGVLFSRDIPALIRERYRAALSGFLEGCGLHLGDIAGFAMHPGGSKVLAALGDALDLPPAALADSREVLRTHGNMSAATVLFVLERMLARRAGGRLLASALGPGFTAGFLLLET
jgi:predicted naringenin-chalcone synthase